MYMLSSIIQKRHTPYKLHYTYKSEIWCIYNYQRPQLICQVGM